VGPLCRVVATPAATILLAASGPTTEYADSESQKTAMSLSVGDFCKRMLPSTPGALLRVAASVRVENQQRKLGASADGPDTGFGRNIDAGAGATPDRRADPDAAAVIDPETERLLFPLVLVANLARRFLL